jgi:hypothetical protein
MNLGRSDGTRARVVRMIDGEPITYRGRNRGTTMTARVGSVFHVYDADTGLYLGRIARRMITRETRSGQRVYVNARWQSPGWVYAAGGDEPSIATPHFRGLEAESRRDAVDRILYRTERAS